MNRLNFSTVEHSENSFSTFWKALEHTLGVFLRMIVFNLNKIFQERLSSWMRRPVSSWMRQYYARIASKIQNNFLGGVKKQLQSCKL